MGEREKRARAVSEALAREYPDASCELEHASPWQLLVATVLSAQCTDARVNLVTPELFSKWPQPADLAEAAQEEVEAVIRSTGVYRQKASALRRPAGLLAERWGGRVPASLEDLVELPGVGRKTAKVVMGEAFGIAAGVTVDTHVRRLARRLGLTEFEDAEKIASELEDMLPPDQWIRFSTRLILHGRRVCMARTPLCDGCTLGELCPQVGLD